MLDALLATIGTLGVLASLIAKHGNTGGKDGAEDEGRAPGGADSRGRASVPSPGRRRGCRRRRNHAAPARGTGR